MIGISDIRDLPKRNKNKREIAKYPKFISDIRDIEK